MENLRTLRTTLTLFFVNDKMLLGEKKRGFAKGTLNGIGGKQDKGETIEQAMIRECQEEIGVTPKIYNLVGRINFNLWYKGEHVNMEMFIYSCSNFDGKIQETEEIKPIWFDVKNIPFDRMLADDLLWLPLVLKGEKVIGKVNFDPNMKMLYHNIKAVKEIEEQEMFNL